MIHKTVMSHVRRGFTLIELLVVITVILLISGMFLGLTQNSNSGGLVGGQRMLASSLKSLRAMALLNQGVTTQQGSTTYNARYRLLILNDPSDPVNHLRQYVIAVGGIDSRTITDGSDPSSIKNTDLRYKWLAPVPASTLPNGVYFIPPTSDTTTVSDPEDKVADSWPGNKKYSQIPKIADTTFQASTFDTGSSMTFLPKNQPDNLGSDGKKWYYVELQPSGASNHPGKVMMILASGVLVPGPSASTATFQPQSANQFSGIVLRPNGDVALTNNADDLN